MRQQTRTLYGGLCARRLSHSTTKIRAKNTCVSANPTDHLFCRPCNFYCLPEKNKKIFIPTDTKMFKKIGQKLIRIAKLMLIIIFCNFLDALNFIMSPTKVDGDILFLVRIPLVSALALASA